MLPGLIDAHTHTFEGALREALIFGVTTELEMMNASAQMMRDFKQRLKSNEGAELADLLSAGVAATVPGGHGTEYGAQIPTLTLPDEAQAFVDARIAEGSDYIKIIYDDYKAFRRGIATLSKETMAAVVEAAHRRGKLAVVHITSLPDAIDALEVGADGLAHLFADQPPDENFGRFVAEHHAFVIPTLTVLESLVDIASGESLITDAHFAPYLIPISLDNLRTSFKGLAKESCRYEFAKEAVKQLKAAGVPILAGTDAPNPGTAHGSSLHRELELLVQAGLTPVEALAAATSIPANIFGLHDRGQIAPGQRADLLLVDEDPSTDIMATRNIVGTWKQGVAVDRQAYRVYAEQKRNEVVAVPTGSESGLVSNFEDGTTDTLFGAGWTISTDTFFGGKSTAHYAVVPDGANGEHYSLQITGELADNQTGATWAGVQFSPGQQHWAPANLSNKKGIAFWAKGDGREYRVMIFAGAAFQIPAQVHFAAGADWQCFTFEVSQFGEVDTSKVFAVIFCAGGAAGKFSFQIDDVRFLA